MAEKMEYLIEGILPKNKLNLIAGPSGSGKTTFLFALIRDWSQGLPVLGHESHPEPFLYIGLDRALDEIDNRIEAAGLDPDAIPHISVLEPALTAKKLLAQIPENTKVLFIDGFFRIVPGGKFNDYHIVADFCIELTKMAEERGLTIIGVTHATKVKQGENFLHPRHRILGSVAWGGFTSTLIFIDSVNPNDIKDNKRHVEILPRCSGTENYYYEIGEKGSFILQEGGSAVLSDETGETPRNLNLYDALPFDEALSTRDILDLGEIQGISRITVMRSLKKWEEDGALVKTGHGQWLKESSRGYNEPGDPRSKEVRNGNFKPRWPKIGS